MDGRWERIERWIDTGLALQGSARAHASALALRRFRRAASALARLPGADSPAGRRALARAEVNVGNVAPTLGESLAAYDAALARLTRSPEPLASSALRGAAWLNRGTRLLRADDSRRLEARANFDEAISALRAAPTDRFVQRNLAAAWMNRAAASALAGDLSEVAEDAERSLRQIAPHEETEAAAAEIGLKARLLWLARPPASPAALADWIGPASDHIDRGLGLLRLWLERGSASLQRPGEALFRVGCAFHLQHLPQFLPEFVRDHLLSWPQATFAAHYFANECTARARSALHQRLLTAPQPAAARRLEELAEVSDALQQRQIELFADLVELVWLRARQHELAGRSEAARWEWRRYLHGRPEDSRAASAAAGWVDHQGGEAAALAFASDPR